MNEPWDCALRFQLLSRLVSQGLCLSREIAQALAMAISRTPECSPQPADVMLIQTVLLLLKFFFPENAFQFP